MLKFLNNARSEYIAVPNKARSEYIEAPSALRPELEEVPADYLELCSKLKWMPGDIRDFKFRKFAFANEIPLYDLEQVTKYLKYLVNKNHKHSDGSGRHRIVWRALRESDGESYFGDQLDFTLNEQSLIGPSLKSGAFYNRIVPMRVLKTINLIQENYSKAKFYVSEIVKIPDPFAAVDIGTKTLHVFAAWDEPGFSG